MILCESEPRLMASGRKAGIPKTGRCVGAASGWIVEREFRSRQGDVAIVIAFYGRFFIVAFQVIVGGNYVLSLKILMHDVDSDVMNTVIDLRPRETCVLPDPKSDLGRQFGEALEGRWCVGGRQVV
ncbi:hypothetical protein HG531_007094 [Fusarium graminearum]|nr:hypothetical protein HG531_007094 [Fusarium graminearum]